MQKRKMKVKIFSNKTLKKKQNKINKVNNKWRMIKNNKMINNKKKSK